MIYKCEPDCPINFNRLDQGNIESAEVGLLRASLSTLGEGMVGGMSLRSKRATLGGESPATPCAGTVSLLTNSSLKPAATNGTSISIKSTAVAVPKKHGPYADKGHLITWVDAMRSQSPPRFRSPHEEAPEAFEIKTAAYSAWLDKHPSALSSFDKVVKHAKSKQIVVFLDYDGTLSPIVDNPDRALMSDEMRATVKELATYFPTAIISGRARPKVYDFVQLSELYYAGSHGMDIMGPAKSSSGFKVNGTRVKDKKGNDVVFFQPASEYLPMMDKVCSILNETTRTVKGARVEHNKYCVTVHFRLVKEELWEGLVTKVQNVLKEYPMLNLTHGRKVLEVRPSIAWDKGKAVNYLLNSLGFADSSDVLPVYIGDDRTDEDAFKLLNGMKHGCSILVSSIPKSTKATLSLREPSEVMEFLGRLVNWKKWGPEKWNGVQNGRYFMN
uniref:Trehalose 6-phosphate phosphatase n=1 Tax=Physcomitrium patens TaxID=3218 RepID=A6MIZ3_PHYPA|nr:trehalose-phosphatase 1 [Physcomitrium patens]